MNTNLALRLKSSVIMAIIAGCTIYYATPPYGLYVLLAIVISMVSLEMDKMRNDNFKILYLMAIPIIVSIYDHELAIKLQAITMLIFLLGATYIARYTNIRLEWVFIQTIYLFTAFIAAIATVDLDKTKITEIYSMLVMVSFVVISTDTLAYMFGNYFGKKFFKKGLSKYSPSKSWEGSLGAILSLGITTLFVFDDFNKDTLIALAVVLTASIVAQLGDLFASYQKRCFNVKDSGSLIAGHGGFFDRFDGFIAVYFLVGIVFAVL